MSCEHTFEVGAKMTQLTLVPFQSFHGLYSVSSHVTHQISHHISLITAQFTFQVLHFQVDPFNMRLPRTSVAEKLSAKFTSPLRNRFHLSHSIEVPIFNMNL